MLRVKDIIRLINREKGPYGTSVRMERIEMHKVVVTKADREAPESHGVATDDSALVNEISRLVTELKQRLKARVGRARGADAEDARRYRRLRVLGAAPYGSNQLDMGTVLCFQNLDDFVDADLKSHPNRGEAADEEVRRG